MTQDSPGHLVESAAKALESHDADFEASRSDSAEPLVDNDKIPPLIHQTSPERPVGVTKVGTGSLGFGPQSFIPLEERLLPPHVMQRFDADKRIKEQ